MAKDKLRNHNDHTKQLVIWAQANGWTISRTGGGHLRLDKEGCGAVFSSSTPSCPYAARKTIKKCQRNEEEAASK